MLTKIIEFSVRNKLIIGLFIIALIGYGSYQATRLPIDAVPDITNNQVQIITIAPSFGATDIERLVTFPIEQANSNISGMKEIRSFSRFGLSLVTIVFDDDVDIYWARQQVAERLQQVQNEIPQGIGTPTLGPISTGLGEIYQYVVKPKKGYEQKFNVSNIDCVIFDEVHWIRDPDRGQSWQEAIMLTPPTKRAIAAIEVKNKLRADVMVVNKSTALARFLIVKSASSSRIMPCCCFKTEFMLVIV